MKKLFLHLRHIRFRSPIGRRGQSFVELALILPVLFVILLGLLEVTMFIGRYLDLLDLTREAARFASVRDPFEIVEKTPVDPRWDKNCSTIDKFDFYYDTSCVFAPPQGTAVCDPLNPENPLPSTPANLRGNFPPWCNGLNSAALIDPRTDDAIISVFSISGGAVGYRSASDYDVWPKPNHYWALSDKDVYTGSNGNWARDCSGNVVRTQPYFTRERVNAALKTDAPPSKGLVAVELYYCYHQVLGIPLFTVFVPDPLQIHVYTLMPLPASQPTATATQVP